MQAWERAVTLSIHSAHTPPTAAKRWYVVHCQAAGERRAAKAIEGLLGLPVYLPEVRQRGDGERSVALFPGYLFVHVDLYEVGPSRINTIPAVLRLVAFGGFPQAIPESAVAALRERVEQLNAEGDQAQPGLAAWAARAPLHDLEPVFAGSMHSSARVRLLFHFLGRLSMASGDTQARAPARKRERLTRGKGRRIRKAQNEADRRVADGD